METMYDDDLFEDTQMTEAAPGRRTGRRRRVAGTALLVVLVAALALSVAGWITARGSAGRLRSTDALRTSATAAARQYGVDFGSYDYRNLHGAGAPWTQIEDHATAGFKSDYQKTSSQLEQTIVAYKATAKASVPVAAVSSISGSRSVVLMQLSQTITNSTQNNGPQTQQFLVTMTMLRRGGQWVIDNVQANL